MYIIKHLVGDDPELFCSSGVHFHSRPSMVYNITNTTQ